MNKGVVMEMNGDSIIVMTPSGTFERIPSKNRSCQIGEEIVYAGKTSGTRQPVWAAASVFVAAVMLCMMLFSGIPAVFADKSVVAYVSIDINPSVELGLDKSQKVREMHGLNEKGLELARTVSYKGKSLDDVTDKLLQKVDEMKLLDTGEADIVIASSVVKEDSSLKDETVSEELKQQVLAYVAAKHPQAQSIAVTAFTAPAEVRETAKENGLSLGKYSVYLGAKSAGTDLKVEDLKQDSVHTIAKEAGGLDKVVDVSKLKKDSIKELLQEEKNGTLDQKVQEKKKEEERKTNSAKPTSGKGNNSKASPTPASGNKAASNPTPKPAVKAGDSAKPSDKNGNSNSDDKKAGAGNSDNKKPDSKSDDTKPGGDKKQDEHKNDDKKNTPGSSSNAKDPKSSANGPASGDSPAKKDDSKNGASTEPKKSSSSAEEDNGKKNGSDDKAEKDKKDSDNSGKKKD